MMVLITTGEPGVDMSNVTEDALNLALSSRITDNRFSVPAVSLPKEAACPPITKRQSLRP